jgi:hypothetical protein
MTGGSLRGYKYNLPVLSLTSFFITLRCWDSKILESKFDGVERRVSLKSKKNGMMCSPPQKKKAHSLIKLLGFVSKKPWTWHMALESREEVAGN